MSAPRVGSWEAVRVRLRRRRRVSHWGGVGIVRIPHAHDGGLVRDDILAKKRISFLSAFPMSVSSLSW